MQIIKQYVSATLSSNLKDDAWHHQTEVLAAVALSGQIGSKLFRVKYANDATSFHSLLQEWTEIVQKKSLRRRWPDNANAKKIAFVSLDYFLNDVCTVCVGRGQMPIDHVPQVLSDFDCKCCHGTGKKPLHAKPVIIDYVKDMIEELDNMIVRAGSATVAKLAKKFNA